jgi:DNA primase
LSDDLDRIRQRIDIVDLVGQKVTLSQRGKTWKGLCPFHDDKNPSFQVNRELGRYRCWACGAQGDIFNWVMETQRLTFTEAMHELAAMAGIKLTKGAERTTPSQREAEDALMALALKFYREQLDKASRALEYCEERGFDRQIRNYWELGYAPSLGDALAQRIKKEGLSLTLAQSLSLVDKDAGGSFFDRFRGRLMVAIRDERSRLVGFGGRILGDGQPKYINSAENPVFQKGRLLYGLHRAKEPMSKGEPAVLVEGYFDVVACHRAGLTTAVAPLGTSLTEDQVRLLSRWTNQVNVLLDGDEAGLKAAERAMEMLIPAGLAPRIITLPSGDDPDTILRREGADGLKSRVAEGKSGLEFRLWLLERRKSPESREFWQELAELIAKNADPLQSETWIEKYAPRFPGVKDALAKRTALREMVTSHRPAPAARSRRREAPKAPRGRRMFTELHSAEIRILSALTESYLVPQADTALREASLWETPMAEKFRAAYLRMAPDRAPQEPLSAWIHTLDDEDFKSFLAWHADKASLLDPEAQEKEIEGAMDRLRERAEARRLRDQMVEPEWDTEALRQLTDRARRLKRGDEAKSETDDDLFA